MADRTYRNLAESILVAHQRADGGCLCRELPLGASWAAHVAELLDRAGALRRRPPSADEEVRP